MSIVFDPDKRIRIQHPHDPTAGFIARPLTYREHLQLTPLVSEGFPDAEELQRDPLLITPAQMQKVVDQAEKLVYPTCRRAVVGWWGFTRKDGTEAPFSPDVIDHLDIGVLQHLCSQILAASSLTVEAAGESR